MASAIKCVCWDEVLAHGSSTWPPVGRRLFAVWPSPHDGNQIFADAGFSDFCDPGPNWDLEYDAILERMTAYMGRYGAPSVRWAIEAVHPLSDADHSSDFPNSVWPMINDPVDQLRLATNWHSDEHADSVIDWGDGSVTIRGGWGVPVFWITVTAGHALDVQDLAKHVADGREVRRLVLNWPAIGPPRGPGDGAVNDRGHR